MSREPIYVTRPLLPPLSEFLPYLEEIWRTKMLTNNGPFHAELEAKLAAHLRVDHLALFTNGTIALITALQALELKGEVITTPYSFVATANALLWNNLTPVFVDIDPRTCNLDPGRIEAAITERTSAILPVHCYGAPCDVESIDIIASKHGLKVIYDAAHAFGVTHDGASLLRHGDLSILSFHATKVFNTFEGGAIVCPDAALKTKIDHLKNFGFVDEVTVVDAGINGKMSEIQAAMGLLQLKHIDESIRQRARVAALYDEGLARVCGVAPVAAAVARSNYSYYPILVTPGSGRSRDDLYLKLREQDVFARRYFYPLISDMPMYAHLPSSAPDNLPNARRIADTVLCLPIYSELSDEDAARVIRIVAE